MIREELALVKQNGAWKPRRKKGWSGLFYPPNGLNFQFCWFNLIFLIAPSWSESNFILFLFFYSIRVGPSRSELIRPGLLAVRVDPVRLLYLPVLEIQVEGGVKKPRVPSVVGVWIFSGITHLLLLKWMDENWSLFLIYKSCPVTYKSCQRKGKSTITADS